MPGVLLLALAAAQGATAPAGAAPVRTWQVDRGTLGVLVEDHRVPTVDVRIEWPAGTWSPWVRTSGAGDGFEIQLDAPDGALRRRADALAADILLSVGGRAAVLEVSCLVADLPAVRQLVADLLRNRSFDRGELERRRDRARILFDASLKDPRFRLGQKAARLWYDTDDARRREWEGPHRGSTDRAALAAARDLLVSLPGRVVGFAGDLTLAEAQAAAAAWLPPLADEPPGGLAPDLRPLADPSGIPRAAEIALPRLTQVYLAYGRDSLPWDAADQPAFAVADHVLAGHIDSRLYVALRHEGGETYAVSSRSAGDVVPAPYLISTATRVANAAHAEAKLRAALAAFHERGITVEELRDAVGYLRGRLPFTRQSPAQVLVRWLGERRLGLPAGFRDAIAERAASLTLAEVNAFIARWYDPERFTLIRLGPAPAAGRREPRTSAPSPRPSAPPDPLRTPGS
jgi:predicted Zn-dependent peptidase